MRNKLIRLGLLSYCSLSIISYPLTSIAKMKQLEDEEMGEVNGRDGIEIYGDIGETTFNGSYARDDNPDAKISIENAKISGFSIPENDPVTIDVEKTGNVQKLVIKAPPITVDTSVEAVRIGNDQASLGGSKTEQLSIDIESIKLWGNQQPGESTLNTSFKADIDVQKHQMIGDSAENTFNAENISTSIEVPDSDPISVDIKKINGVEKLVIAAPKVLIDSFEIETMYHGDDANRYGGFGISAIELSFEAHIDDGGAFSDQGLNIALANFSVTTGDIVYRGFDPNANTFTIAGIEMQGFTDPMYMEMVEHNGEYQLLLHAPSMTVSSLTTGDLFLGESADGVFGSLAMVDATFGVSAYISDGGLFTDTGLRVELGFLTADIGSLELRGDFNNNINDFNKLVINNLSFAAHSLEGQPAIFEINSFEISPNNFTQGLYFSVPGVILDNLSIESIHLGNGGASFGGLQASSHVENGNFVPTTMSGFMTDGGFSNTGVTFYNLAMTTALDAAWVGAGGNSFHMDNLHLDMAHPKLVMEIDTNNNKEFIFIDALNTTIFSAGVGSMYLNPGYSMGGLTVKNAVFDIKAAITDGTDTLGLDSGIQFVAFVNNSKDQNNNVIPIEYLRYHAGPTDAETASLAGVEVNFSIAGEMGIVDEAGIQKIALKGEMFGVNFLSVDNFYVGNNPAISFGSFSLSSFASDFDLRLYGGAPQTGVGLTWEGDINAEFDFQYIGFKVQNDPERNSLNVNDLSLSLSFAPSSIEIVQNNDNLDRLLITTEAEGHFSTGLIRLGTDNGFNFPLTLGTEFNNLKITGETYLWGDLDTGLNIASTSKMQWGDINALETDLNGIVILGGNGGQPGYDNTVFKDNIIQSTYGYVQFNNDIAHPINIDVKNVEVANNVFVPKLVITMNESNSQGFIYNLVLGKISEGNKSFGGFYFDNNLTGELKLSGMTVNNVDKLGFEISGTIGLSGSEFHYRGKIPLYEVNSAQFEGITASISIPDNNPNINQNQGVQVYIDTPQNETALVIDIAKMDVSFGALNIHFGYDNEFDWNNDNVIDIVNYNFGGFSGKFTVNDSQLLISSNSHVGIDIDGNINISDGKFTHLGASNLFFPNLFYGYNTTNFEDVNFSLNMTGMASINGNQSPNQQISMYIQTPTNNNNPTDITKLIVEIPQVSGSLEGALRIGVAGLHDWNGNNMLEEHEQNYVIGGLYLDQYVIKDTTLQLWGIDGGAAVAAQGYFYVDRMRLAALSYLGNEISKQNAINLEGIEGVFVTNKPMQIYLDTKLNGIKIINGIPFPVPGDRTWLYAEFGGLALDLTVDTIRFGEETFNNNQHNYRIGGFDTSIDFLDGSYLAISGSPKVGIDLAGYLLMQGDFTYFGTENFDNNNNLVFTDTANVGNMLTEITIPQDKPISIYHETDLKNDPQYPAAGPSKLVIGIPSLTVNMIADDIILSPENPNNAKFAKVEVENLHVFDSTMKIYGRGFGVNDPKENKFGGLNVEMLVNTTIDEIRMIDADSFVTFKGITLNLQTLDQKPIEIGLQTEEFIIPLDKTRLIIETNQLAGRVIVGGVYLSQNAVDPIIGFSIQNLPGLDLNGDGQLNNIDNAGFLLTSRTEIWGRDGVGLNISGTSSLRAGELQLRLTDNALQPINLRKIRSDIVLGSHDKPLSISLFTEMNNNNFLSPTSILFELPYADISTKIDEMSIGVLPDRSMGGLHLSNLIVENSSMNIFRSAANPNALSMYGNFNITDGTIVWIDDVGTAMGLKINGGIDDSDQRVTLSGLYLSGSISKNNPLAISVNSNTDAINLIMPQLTIQKAGVKAVTVGNNGASLGAFETNGINIVALIAINNLPGSEIAINGAANVKIDNLLYFDTDSTVGPLGMHDIAFIMQNNPNNPITIGVINVGQEQFAFFDLPETELAPLFDNDPNNGVIDVLTIGSIQIDNDVFGGFAIQSPEAEIFDPNDPNYDPEAFMSKMSANVKVKGHAGGGIDVAVTSKSDIYQMEYDSKDGQNNKVQVQKVHSEVEIPTSKPMTVDVMPHNNIQKLTFGIKELNVNASIGAMRINNGASLGSVRMQDVQISNAQLRVWGH